jgi:hypothetical protein
MIVVHDPKVVEAEKEAKKEDEKVQKGWIYPPNVSHDSFLCDSGITPPAHRIEKKRWKKLRKQKVVFVCIYISIKYFFPMFLYLYIFTKPFFPFHSLLQKK